MYRHRHKRDRRTWRGRLSKRLAHGVAGDERRATLATRAADERLVALERAHHLVLSSAPMHTYRTALLNQIDSHITTLQQERQLVELMPENLGGRVTTGDTGTDGGRRSSGPAGRNQTRRRPATRGAAANRGEPTTARPATRGAAANRGEPAGTRTR